MCEFLEIASVKMWVAEAIEQKPGSSMRDEWVDYTKYKLMDWLTFCMRHNVIGFNTRALREILYIPGDHKFNKWADLYCDMLEWYLEEVK